MSGFRPCEAERYPVSWRQAGRASVWPLQRKRPEKRLYHTAVRSIWHDFAAFGPDGFAVRTDSPAVGGAAGTVATGFSYRERIICTPRSRYILKVNRL